MIDTANITTIVIFESKSKLIVRCWSIEIKKEVKNIMYWIKKGPMTGEKQIPLMDFQYILENQTFQRTAKLIMADFYESEFMKGILRYIKVYYIRKSRWDVKYLGKSLRYWSWDEGGNECSIFLLESKRRPTFKKRQAYPLGKTSYYFFFITFKLSM